MTQMKDREREWDEKVKKRMSGGKCAEDSETAAVGIHRYGCGVELHLARRGEMKQAGWEKQTGEAGRKE